MKTILNIILILAFTNTVIGQDLVTTSNNTNTFQYNKSLAISPAKQERIAKRQNKAVAIQLQKYIASAVSYSDVMSENYMEGEIIIQVDISEKGLITKTKVVKSPNAALTQVVLKAMEGFTEMELAEAVYYGHRKVRIPVSFSMR